MTRWGTGIALDNGLEPRFCTACGKPLTPGARFCAICGVQVVRPQARAILPQGQAPSPAGSAEGEPGDQGESHERD